MENQNKQTQEQLNTRVLAGTRYEAFYKSTGLPLQYMYQDITLKPEPIDYEVFKCLKKICDKPRYFFGDNRGNHVYICSHNVGNGKTSWAIKIMKRYMQEYAVYYDVDCVFINVPEFFEKRKRSFSNYDEKASFMELEKRVQEAKLVIFDDISIKTSDFDGNYLYTIIDSRLRNGKNNIYTSNVLPNYELYSALGDRIADRMLGERTVRMWIQGGSRR